MYAKTTALVLFFSKFILQTQSNRFLLTYIYSKQPQKTAIMNKKLRYGIAIILVIIILIYLYTYKPHRNINTETAAYSVTVAGLQKEFTTNESLALRKYQDQTIELTAQVTTVDTQNKALVMDQKLYAIFNESLSKKIIPGKKLKIKGRFLGYDELLEEFKMDQSSIVH